MIEFVVAHNPDDRVLAKAKKILTDGGLVCIPTDTNWVAICDPYNKSGVDKLYRLKNEEKSKHFSLLCPDISIASQVADIDNQVFRQINSKIPGHFTFIFNATKQIRKALKSSKTDHQVGLRFPPKEFTQNFLKFYGNVLLSTNLTHEILGVAEESIEIYSYLIEDSLSNVIELIIDPQEVRFSGESTIVDFTSGAPEILRQGVGEL